MADARPPASARRRATARRRPQSVPVRTCRSSCVVVTYLVLLVAWPVVAGGQEHVRQTASRTSGDLFVGPRRRPRPAAHRRSSPSSPWSSTPCSASASRSCWCATSSPASGCSAPSSTCRCRSRRSWSGSSLVLVYGGRSGWFGPALEDAGFQVIFATPGIILATTFVALPLVIREVVPVLEEIGIEQEQAARSLGASALPDVPAHHAAGHQVGARLRRRAQPGPLPRRVRGGQGRVRQRARRDPHRHPRRRGEVPELRPGRRLRHRVPAGPRVGGLHRHRLDHPSRRSSR